MWLFRKAARPTELENESRVYTLQDYDATYFYIKKVMVLVGLRLTRRDSHYIKLFWEVFYWFEIANLLVALALNVITIQMIFMGISDNAIALIRMMPCVGFIILAIMKSYKIVYKRSVFENLIEELRSIWPQGEVSEEEHTVLSSSLKEIHFVAKAMYYCNYVLVFNTTVPPFVNLIRRALGQKDVPHDLTFSYWVPGDLSNDWWFQFVLILESWETIYCVLFVVSADLLFCVFLNHITIQFELLCIKIERLFQVPTDQRLISSYPLGKYYHEMSKDAKDRLKSLSATEQNAIHKKKLAEIIIRHNTLIRLANDVEYLFSFSLLYNFISSAIIICFCSLCSVLIEKWNTFMYKNFLISAMSETWLLCWYGQKLVESSQRVANALYNSGWYTASNDMKKYILIMINRSQKSVHITTNGFSIISLRSYTAIMKTAWSYFTLLLNFYEK